jgi:hypothetical protein
LQMEKIIQAFLIDLLQWLYLKVSWNKNEMRICTKIWSTQFW